MTLPRILSASSPVRLLGDLAWLVAFGATLGGIVLRPGVPSAMRAGVALELVAGEQRRALFRGNQRLLTIGERVRRVGSGWTLEQWFQRGAEHVGELGLVLQPDLTPARFHVRAEIGRIAELVGAASGSELLSGLEARLSVVGRCDPQEGTCRLRGSLGGLRLERTVTAGRGPVLPSAVYPLLARGVLGRKAEISIFDPLLMRARTVSYELRGRERLALRSGTFEALRIIQDLGGQTSELWLDGRGRVLKEKLPFGIVVEHEAFALR